MSVPWRARTPRAFFPYTVCWADVSRRLSFSSRRTCPHLGESLASVTFQPGILLACISRGAKVLFPGGGDSLQAGDTVIVVAPRERHIAELRQIFAERG